MNILEKIGLIAIILVLFFDIQGHQSEVQAAMFVAGLIFFLFGGWSDDES